MKDIVVKAEHITKLFYKTHKKSSLTDLSRILLFSKKAQDKDCIIALNDLSLELKKGELLGIIGNNGAGKSTLLKVLCGIMMPSSGKVLVDEEMASFFDISSAIVPELTGKENIFILGKFQGLSSRQIKEIYPVIAEFSELDDFLDTPVKYYSSGMVMRLAFSVMIHAVKKIFLFDEVFSVGDILFQAKCHKMLYKLKNEGCSMILVSHNLNELATLCDRIILMDKGKFIASGNWEDLIKPYNDIISKTDKKSGKRSLLLQRLKNNAEDNSRNKLKWSPDDAVGDDSCRMLSAELIGLTEDGIVKDQNLSLKIHVKFFNFSGAIGFIVSDMLDHKLFGDITSAHIDFSQKPTFTGDYDLLWKIPLDKLNHGLFKISIHILDSNHNSLFRIINSLSFEVIHSEYSEFKLYTPVNIDLQFDMAKR